MSNSNKRLRASSKGVFMTNDELVRANELADGLIAKFERIKALWAEIPGADDFDDLGKKLGSVAGIQNEIIEKQGDVGE